MPYTFLWQKVEHPYAHCANELAKDYDLMRMWDSLELVDEHEQSQEFGANHQGHLTGEHSKAVLYLDGAKKKMAFGIAMAFHTGRAPLHKLVDK